MADYLMVIVTFLGICAVIWQVGKEYRHSLTLQQENFKDRIKHDIFIRLSDEIHKCSKKYGDLGSLISSIPRKYSFQQTQKELGLGTGFVDVGEPEINEASSTASQSYIELLFLIERYEIALPRITTSRLIIYEHLNKLSEMHTRYLNFFRDYLPIDVPEEKVEDIGATVLTRKEADNQIIQQMEAISEEYNGLTIDMVSYMEDLRVIMQNELLGHLFERKLKGRTLNPSKYVVLKNDDDDNMKKIKNTLLREGSWGKAMQRTQHGMNVDQSNYTTTAITSTCTWTVKAWLKKASANLSLPVM